MELDKRIKDIGTIQTILQHDVNCIGCKGYFFDEFVDTKDLSGCCRYGELIELDFARDQNDLIFKAELKNGNTNFFRFFIPEDALNPVEPEKKFRAFTLAEWADKHEIGEIIHFSYKDGRQEFNVMYTGYVIEHGEDIQDVRTIGRIMLLGTAYFLEDLFENYVICIDGIWQPFGVMEE